MTIITEEILVEDETKSRLQILRDDLAKEYPESVHLYSNAYLQSVLSAPDKYNRHKSRTLTYTRNKLLDALNFRSSFDVPTFTDAMDMSKYAALNSGSIYWHGYDNELRPILWVHPGRKDWKNIDIQHEACIHVLMIEYGIKLMPPGVTTFTIIACTDQMGFGVINPWFAKTLLSIATKGYPDRLGSLYAGTVNLPLRAIYSLLSPLMPLRLTNKITLMAQPATELEVILAKSVSENVKGAMDSSFESVVSDRMEDKIEPTTNEKSEASVVMNSDKSIQRGDSDGKKVLPNFFGGYMEHDIFDENGEFSWQRMVTYMDHARSLL
eukprot:CFRG4503T1